jgi:hypothetical protein
VASRWAKQKNMNSNNLQLARLIQLQEAIKKAKEIWVESLPQSQGKYGMIGVVA